MTAPTWEADTDLVVVGSGVAGLSAALEASRLGLRTLVVCKGIASDTNTRWAQGGVAVVLPDDHDPGDSVRQHIDDTLAAGAGLCDEPAVAAILAEGAEAVGALRGLGATFDTSVGGRLARTREGGHTAYRVVHAGGDATGAEVERALVAGARSFGLTVLEQHTAIDLLFGAGRGPLERSRSLAGLKVLGPDGTVGVLRSRAVLLATGGLGQLYAATSNPEVATGDGIALALRAGAEVADLEFVQFHPTVLFAPGCAGEGRRPLVTEAVRGEGAVLVDGAGKRVMQGVHPLEDLAPRDVVSAAITRRLTERPGGIDDHVFLDATHLGRAAFRARFPTVYAACRAAGIEPSSDPIPVAPAAHFSCGGVLTSVDGRTRIPGLYAAGEVARTGLHGANRLASNSLLEGLVVGRRVARAVLVDGVRPGQRTDLGAAELEGAGGAGAGSGYAGEAGSGVGSGVEPDVGPVLDRARLQRAMSRYVGIGRDPAGLAAARAEIRLAGKGFGRLSRRTVEDAALEVVARTIVAAALARTESRGCHVRTDRPERDDTLRHSLVVRLDDAGNPMVAGVSTLGGVA